VSRLKLLAVTWLGFITEGGSYFPEVVFEVYRNALLAYEYQTG
jgi:hypothetical protein